MRDFNKHLPVILLLLASELSKETVRQLQMEKNCFGRFDTKNNAFVIDHRSTHREKLARQLERDSGVSVAIIRRSSYRLTFAAQPAAKKAFQICL
jgi:hypothetical protein